MSPDLETVRSVVQDVFIRVHVRIQGGKGIHGGISGFRAFLRDTAHYLWLDHLRAGKRLDTPFPTVGDLDVGGEFASARNPLLDARDAKPDPLDALLADEDAFSEALLAGDLARKFAAEFDESQPGKGYLRLFDLQVQSWQQEAAGKKPITQTEMAHALGCSQAAISGYRKRLFDYLRRRWETRAQADSRAALRGGS